VRLEHLQDDELREGLEAGDEPVLLQHLGQDAKDEGAGGTNVVGQILNQEAEDRPRNTWQYIITMSTFRCFPMPT
jgi:hypothetical protein